MSQWKSWLDTRVLGPFGRIKVLKMDAFFLFRKSMNLLDLHEDAREKFILALSDVADIIVLERTNAELRDWIRDSDIYRRWERKHFGKTDKWRILLLQEFGIKRKQILIFRFKINVLSVSVSMGIATYTIILTRADLGHENDALFDEIRRKFKHYVRGYVLGPMEDLENWKSIPPFNTTTSIGLYYFMYDLLRLGFEYEQTGDMEGNVFEGGERLIRSSVEGPECPK